MKFIILFLFLTSTALAQQFPDRHSTDLSDSWTSCTATENPNKVREDSHWIMYDFGNEYKLQGTTVWNVNAYEQTDIGTQELVIDYSNDGEEWTELAYHTMSEAPASSFYEGEEGPNFDGINARYVIITSLTNFGHATCYGLSEVRFQATIATSSTDIEEQKLIDNNIEVSPNPFDNETMITLTDLRLGTYNYSVVDITGKQFLNGSIDVSSEKVSLLLNMGNFTAGAYIFRLQYDTLTISKQLQLIK